MKPTFPDYFPTEFEVDCSGKRKEWEGIVLLPMVNTSIISKLYGEYKDKLRFEGSEYIYTSDKEKERCEWSYKKIESVKIELEYDNGKTLILSGDKDFIQLHKYKNVSQYSPITKRMINGTNPKEYLEDHILKGDTSDGIPNVLSPDHTFTERLRQRPLGKKKIENFKENGLPTEEIKRNYQRNEKLINLSLSPDDLYITILKEYQEALEGDRSKLLDYFIEKRLRNLTESIGEF